MEQKAKAKSIINRRASNFCSLAEASEWAQSKGVKSQTEWGIQCRIQGWRPKHIPSTPRSAYGKDAWNAQGGWGGFLGTGRVQTGSIKYLSLKEASAWAATQGVPSFNEWIRQVKIPRFLPFNVPSNPQGVYGDEFRRQGGWPAFLGQGWPSNKSRIEMALRSALTPLLNLEEHDTGTIRTESGKLYRVDIVDRVRRIAIEYDGRWYHHKKHDFDLKKTKELSDSKPSWTVIRVRESGLGMRLIQDDLDVWVDGNASPHDRIIQVATHLRKLIDSGLLRAIDDLDRTTLLSRFDNLISNGVDFKLLSSAATKGWRNLSKAQEWASKQNIAGQKEWAKRCKEDPAFRPADIPHSPHGVYGKSFVDAGGWGWFLGTGNACRPRRYCTLAEAIAWVSKQGIKTRSEWFEKCKKIGFKPDNIPEFPHRAYGGSALKRAGGWNAYLGISPDINVHSKFRSLEDAAAWARDQKFTSVSEWRKKIKDPAFRPHDIPADPMAAYGRSIREMGGMTAFLGTKIVAPKNKTMMTIEEAQEWASAQRLRKTSEWFVKCREPGWRHPHVPSNPQAKYGKDFIARGGWGWFLGTGRPARGSRSRISNKESEILLTID